MSAQVRPTSAPCPRGGPVPLQVFLDNPRQVIAGLRVQVLGADPDWVDLPEPAISLFPGESRTLDLTLHLPEAMPAGRRQVTVQVSELTEPYEVTHVPVTLDVPEHARLDLRIEPLLLRAGRRATFRVLADNQGNTTIRAQLRGLDDEAKLRFTFRPEHLYLAPGEQAVVQATARARRRLCGLPVPRMFTVHADHRTAEEGAAGAPLPDPLAQATLLQRPLLSRTALSLATVALTLLTVAGSAAVAVGKALAQSQKQAATTNALIAALADPAPIDPPGSHCPCTLTGTVTDGTNRTQTPGAATPSGTPKNSNSIAGVTVALYPPTDTVNPTATATTTPDGRWHLDGLAAGTYLIHLAHPGHAPTWYPQAATAAEATPLTITRTRTLSDPLRLDLTNGSITGHITLVGADGDAGGVKLTLRPTATAPSTTSTPSAPLTAWTGPDGTFTLDEVPTPGFFSLAATNPGYLATQTPIDLAPGEHHTGALLILQPAPGLPFGSQPGQSSAGTASLSGPS